LGLRINKLHKRRGKNEIITICLFLVLCWQNKLLNAVNGLTLLSSADSTIDLARHLILKSIIPLKAVEDALHIALATIHGMDYLLTWNCRLIANMEIQRNIAHYLESIGLLMPIMCTPEELLGENDDDTTG